MATVHTKPRPTFRFTPCSTRDGFGARIGRATLTRPGLSEPLQIDTPAIIAVTSRGAVPHLSADHVATTNAIQWVHIPFESFLDRNPPVPTLQPGHSPLHAFLNYKPTRNIISLSLRDPADDREMPPNGNHFVSAYCIRGVKKVSPAAYRSYVLAANPDLVFALTDAPFTPAPHSQKRLTKSIERSWEWLSRLLAPLPTEDTQSAPSDPHPLNVVVHMAGSTSIPAREVFAESLLESLHGPEREAIKPYQRLIDGICGLSFNLVPLRRAVLADSAHPRPNEDAEPPAPLVTPEHGKDKTSLPRRNTTLLTGQRDASLDVPSQPLVELLLASLAPLGDDAHRKMRIVHGAKSPHEMLQLVLAAGVDLFDTHWAQRAADVGVAFDFVFPAPTGPPTENLRPGATLRADGRRDIGHNLYDAAYACDFGRPADDLLDWLSASSSTASSGKICPCAACSPLSPRLASTLVHSGVDASAWPTSTDDSAPTYQPPVTRAYLHHLLHTHEMSSHALLAMHNLTVLDLFFQGVRNALARDDGAAAFAEEVARFEVYYDDGIELFEEARKAWREIELARGRGRLTREREKEKQQDTTLGTAVEL